MHTFSTRAIDVPSHFIGRALSDDSMRIHM
jgi:hypothetical protein